MTIEAGTQRDPKGVEEEAGDDDSDLEQDNNLNFAVLKDMFAETSSEPSDQQTCVP